MFTRTFGALNPYPWQIVQRFSLCTLCLCGKSALVSTVKDCSHALLGLMLPPELGTVIVASAPISESKLSASRVK